MIEHRYDDGNNRVLTRYPVTDLYRDGVESQNVRLVVDRSFDAFGNLLHETLMHPEGESQAAGIHYSYDISGRLADLAEAVAVRHLDGLIHYTQSFCFRQMFDQTLREHLPVPILTTMQSLQSAIAAPPKPMASIS